MKKNTCSHCRTVFLLLMFLVFLAVVAVFFVKRSTGYAVQTKVSDTVIQLEESVEEQPARTARKAGRRTEAVSRNAAPEEIH